VTDGFAAEFGAERVLDAAVLAENAIIGAATGAAIEGLRPVCEMQFADFIACGSTNSSTSRPRCTTGRGSRCRSSCGCRRAAASPAAPSTRRTGGVVPADAGAEGGRAGHRGGRQGAADERDPRSQPGLLPRAQGPLSPRAGQVPEGEYTVPIGEAHVAREGSAMTVIAYGSAVHLALERRAARRRHRGDRPPDPLPARREAILTAVRRTGKVLIAHEATRACGVGAEVAALIGEEAFEDLDAPIRRLTAPDVPIPFSPPLEQAVLPQLEDIEEACRELLAY